MITQYSALIYSHNRKEKTKTLQFRNNSYGNENRLQFCIMIEPVYQKRSGTVMSTKARNNRA